MSSSSGLDSGFRIAWTTSAVHDRVLIEDVAGKFDIGDFSINQPQPTPDQKLDFVARATDGDGDFKTASFSIGIDGTGTPVPPGYDDGHFARPPVRTPPSAATRSIVSSVMATPWMTGRSIASSAPRTGPCPRTGQYEAGKVVGQGGGL